MHCGGRLLIEGSTERADSCRLNMSCKKILIGSWDKMEEGGNILNVKGDEEKFLFGCCVGNLGKRLFFWF